MFKQENRFEDQGNIKNTLQIVLMLCFFGTGLLGLNSFVSGFVPTAIGLFAGMVYSGVMLILTLQNKFNLARLSIPPVTFVTVVYLVIVGEGIRDEAILGFALVIALAGLLIGREWTIVYTAAGVMAVTIIGLGQANGWFPRFIGFNISSSRIIVTDILLFFIGAILYITIANLERVLEHVKEREIELEETNQALVNIQAGLEERIAQRVINLNTAREEAEAAREEIEKQVWQTTGLALLGNVIRGEQEIPELGSKVIQHLCLYLDAQVGAIFLRNGNDQLERIGSYACPKDQPSTFAFGEGIVGQAAKGKETIHLADIPEDAFRITSGLSSVLPSNIIAVPLMHIEEVLGVYELGSLHSFNEHQLQFLANATESICVAFHTAQTRAQVDQLFAQTRAQAEELQEQGEELRAINEELEAQAENLRVANQKLLE